jgi:5'-deoxynucleotidase YfbR-like HD superfamily hydrolase
MTHLDKQIEFILELDKLKSVMRRSILVNGERFENSAEHSWHVSVLAIIVAEHSEGEIDLQRVLKMLLLHDVVEIDAGDTYFFDTKGNSDKAERETKAAQRIFGLLPGDQAVEFREAWEEHEAGQTSEAIFARALDRFIPLLHNYHTQGKSWQEHQVRLEQVMTLKEPIEKGSKSLWAYASKLIQSSVEKGYLRA